MGNWTGAWNNAMDDAERKRCHGEIGCSIQAKILEEPRKAKWIQKRVREEYKKQGGILFPKNRRIGIHVVSYVKVPWGTPMTKRKRMLSLLDGFEENPPELKDFMSCILEALKGIAYEDEAQIVSLENRKGYDITPYFWFNVYELLD